MLSVIMLNVVVPFEAIHSSSTHFSELLQYRNILISDLLIGGK
jgi:hypothetical protein